MTGTTTESGDRSTDCISNAQGPGAPLSMLGRCLGLWHARWSHRHAQLAQAMPVLRKVITNWAHAQRRKSIRPQGNGFLTATETENNDRPKGRVMSELPFASETVKVADHTLGPTGDVACDKVQKCSSMSFEERLVNLLKPTQSHRVQF